MGRAKEGRFFGGLQLAARPRGEGRVDRCRITASQGLLESSRRGPDSGGAVARAAAAAQQDRGRNEQECRPDSPTPTSHPASTCRSVPLGTILGGGSPPGGSTREGQSSAWTSWEWSS